MNPRLSAVLAFILTACSKGAGSTDVVVRDSAGVRIIEHSAVAIAAAPLWTTGPAMTTVSHGALDDQTLSQVNGAARLPDGRIALVDADNAGTRLLLFKADGAFERQLGGIGDGPGEFRFGRILRVSSNDTIVIFNAQSGRVTRFLTSGALAGTQELAQLGPMAIGFPVGTLADGRIVSTAVSFGEAANGGAGHFRQHAPVILVDPAAATLDTVSTSIPGPEVYITTTRFGDRTESFPNRVAYGRATFVAPFGDAVHVLPNESPQLETYALPWSIHRIVRFELPQFAVDAAAREAYLAANIAELAGTPSPMKEALIETVRATEFADSLAYYEAMRAAADGTLWIRLMRTKADSIPHYLLVGIDGKLAARAELPKGARLLWAGSDQVLILILDDDGVQRVELRPILKTAGVQ